MGKFYDQIPEFLLGWIPQQAIFWVATAALAQDGHVNVSPKGLQGSFHVVSPARGQLARSLVRRRDIILMFVDRSVVRRYDRIWYVCLLQIRKENYFSQ